MTDKQLKDIKRRMNDGSWRYGFSFDEVHCFKFGKDKFAIGVWSETKNVAADEKNTYRLSMFGDPHCSGSYKHRYNTPFTESRCQICVVSLDKDGNYSGHFCRLKGTSHTAYEYEGGSRELQLCTVDARTEFTLGEYRFGVNEYVDMTNMDDLGACILREVRGMPNDKRVEQGIKSTEMAAEEAQWLAKVQEILRVCGAGCRQLMSAEENDRWKRIEKFGKLRQDVMAKRVTLAQKIGAKIARKVKIMSAGYGK